MDTIPPEVVSVSPQPDSTGIDPNSEINVTFSERMSEDPTEGAIFISPFPKKPIDYRWRGKRLNLSPSEPFLKDRTYVVTVGTDAQDLRGNRMSQSYTFAFSTGNSLDSGSISGEVWVSQKTGFANETGVSVWAYLLAGEKTEIDPEKEKPDYATQTDENGKYSLKNLGRGRYRLLAVKDANKDLLWNWEDEAIGVTTQDVELSGHDLSKDFVNFIVEKRDKRPPTLTNCRSLNKNLVRLEFDEEVEETTASNLTHYQVSSSSTRNPLNLISVFFRDPDRNAIFLLTDGMNAKEKYEIKVLGVTDKARNPLDTAATTCLFDGSETVDTVGPRISAVSPKDSETTVPLDAKIQIVFDQPPEHHDVEANFAVFDSNGSKIVGKTGWSSPNVFIFSPDSLLLGRMTYTITLLSSKVHSLVGNTHMRDSTFVSRFRSLNPDTVGSVSGKVETVGGQNGNIALSLYQAGNAAISYRTTIPGPAPFLFDRVLPGKYFLAGFVDSDKNGNLSLGQPNPFSPSEPFALYPDTILVRSRWETEGVELEFR